MVNDLPHKYEGRDVRDIMRADNVAPLTVFEPNKDYVNAVLKAQMDLQPPQHEVRAHERPSRVLEVL